MWSSRSSTASCTCCRLVARNGPAWQAGAARAILTARGGMTSHAAVVARGMGKTCVVGAKELDVDPTAGRFRVNGRAVKRGQVITVDGTTGRVILGAAKLVTPKVGKEFDQ